MSTCQFSEGPAPMHRATLEITVYEARTGTQVGEPVTLEGQSQDSPMFAWYRGSSSSARPKPYTTPTEQQYRDALAPYLQR